MSRFVALFITLCVVISVPAFARERGRGHGNRGHDRGHVSTKDILRATAAAAVGSMLMRDGCTVYDDGYVMTDGDWSDTRKFRLEGNVYWARHVKYWSNEQVSRAIRFEKNRIARVVQSEKDRVSRIARHSSPWRQTELWTRYGQWEAEIWGYLGEYEAWMWSIQASG